MDLQEKIAGMSKEEWLALDCNAFFLDFWRALQLRIRKTYKLHTISDDELRSECYLIVVPRLRRAIQNYPDHVGVDRLKLLGGTAKSAINTEFRRHITRISDIPREFKYSESEESAFSVENLVADHGIGMSSVSSDVVLHAAPMENLIPIAEYSMGDEAYVDEKLAKDEKNLRQYLEAIREDLTSDHYKIITDLILKGKSRREITDSFETRTFSSICTAIDHIKHKLFKAIPHELRAEYFHLLPMRFHSRYLQYAPDGYELPTNKRGNKRENKPDNVVQLVLKEA